MQDIAPTPEALTGTQSRQLFPLQNSKRTKIRHVDSRLLTVDPMDLRVGDVELLVKELRRVVAALDELGGFED